ncbi:hypothetical protein LJD42_28745, partial [Escherichia coli]|nr:hypothetical protein [Escherichia coli]
DLAMHLARLYDVGHSQRHPNKLDVVSIPLAYRLLRQKRCVTALTRRARNWLPHDISFANQFEQDCSRAIERAYAVYPQVFGASNGRKSLQILKEFRDVFMAHSLMKNSNANPVYNQLFQLTDHA